VKTKLHLFFPFLQSKLPQDHCQRAYTHSTYRETRSTPLKDLENLPDCGYSISVTIAFLELDKVFISNESHASRVILNHAVFFLGNNISSVIWFYAFILDLH
jgi:hypothetical protein